jgi:hypothetical protein
LQIGISPAWQYSGCQQYIKLDGVIMRKYMFAGMTVILSLFLFKALNASSATSRKPQQVLRTAKLTLLMALPKEGNLKTDPVFSPDGSKVAAFFSLGKKSIVMENGKEAASYEEVRNLSFDRNNSLILTGRKDGQWHLVTGVNAGKGYQDIVYLGVLAGNDDIWWLAGDGNDRLYTLMRNRVAAGKPICNPSTLYSLDRKRIAVSGFRDEKRVFFVNGVEQLLDDTGDNDNSGDKKPYFDHEGALHFLKITSTNGGNFIDFGGKKHGGYESIGSWTVSPDGRQVAYSACKEQRYGFMMVRNGTEGKMYKNVGAPLFSPDGSKLAYIVQNGPAGQKESDGEEEDPKSYAVVMDERKGRDYANVRKLIFSPDSSKLAYIADNNMGKSLVVINGTEGTAYDDITDVVFSPDSRHYAFRARADSRWFIVVDDQEGESFHWVGVPAFSVDGRHLTYGARGGITLLKDAQGRILAYPVRKKRGEPYLDLQVDARGLTYANHKSGERLWTTTDGWIYTSRNEDELYWVNETIAELPNGTAVTPDTFKGKPHVTFVSKAKGAKSLPFGFSYADRNVITGQYDQFAIPTLFSVVPRESGTGRKKAPSGDEEEYAIVFQKFDLREVPFSSDEKGF